MSYIGNSPGVASQRVTTTLTATAGQTQFTTQSGYVLGYVDVYLNGAKLVNGSDFEAITGTYITLFAGAAVGDVIELISYVPRGLSDGYTKAEADAKFLDVGGDTASGSIFLGAGGLVVGTTQLVTSGTNNVGINTASPKTNGATFGTLTLNGSNGGAIQFTTADVNIAQIYNDGNALFINPSTGKTLSLQVAGSTVASVSSTGISITGTLSNTTGVGLATASGNVGIGISSASASGKLHVYQTQGSMYIDNAGGIPRMRLGGGNGWGFNRITASEDIFFGEPGDTGTWRVRGNGTISLGVGSTATTMTIQGNGGNVGIGSTSYGNAGSINLSIGDPGTTIGGLQLWSTTTGNHYVQFGDGATGGNPYRGAIGYNHNTDNLVFYSAGAIGMTLTGSALYTADAINVGIGTSSPSTYGKLAVRTSTNQTALSVYCNDVSTGLIADFRGYDNSLGELSRLSIQAGGTVFIGTSTNTNSSKLVVNGTISQTVGGTQYLVVDQSDVGTAQNQIPLNQYLGSLAFQEREAVNFTGGTGALSSLDLAAISTQLNVTAIDVFVYDTSRDSDGGAWRKRCQHTSWYNETLNTATRGSRREFPAVAVIVLTASGVTIYDADSPDMPMWMVFYSTSSSGWNSSLFPLTGVSNALTSVTAVNGIIAVGTSYNTIGLVLIKLISDNTFIYCTGNFGGIDSAPLVLRNSSGHTFASDNTSNLPGLSSIYVNDVTHVVLPGAPVDPSTQMLIPTFIAATNVGVSILHSNNAVVTWLNTVGYCNNVTVTDGNGLQMSGGGGVAFYSWGINSIPWTSTNSYDYIIGNTWNPNSNSLVRQGSNGNSTLYNLTRTADGTANTEYPGASTNEKLMLVARNKQLYGNSLQAYITSTYNTGWMPGGVKGAWLSDTRQETLYRSNRLSTSNFTGWTAGGGWTISSGTASHVSGNAGYVSIAAPTTANRAYTLKVTGTFSTANALLLANHGIGGANVTIPVTASTGTFYVTWTQGRDQQGSIVLYTGSICSITGVELFDADADRCFANYPLDVYGTVTKTPVAAGADLVGYGNFSGSNYLQQPYRSEFNFGTGDYSIIAWFKTSLSGTYNEIIDLAEAGSNVGRLEFLVGNLGNLYLYTGTPGTAVSSPNGAVKANVWTHCCASRSNGITSVYVNGVFMASAASAENHSNVNAKLFVGINYAGGNVTATDQLALLRMSSNALSADQIAKSYHDEKQLFQENAKATLYGTSDYVYGLGYDDDTKRLHAGTGQGRSVFQGLRRIDNTTTGTTVISAADGLVAES